MFRRTASIVTRTDDGEELIIEKHGYYQGDAPAPGMKQYRTKGGTSVKRISATEFEIAGPKGARRARVLIDDQQNA